MTKFILLYRGAATPQEEMTEEQMNEVMGKWKVWMEGIGTAMLDMGQPMGNSTAIVDDGSEGAATQLSGYSIIQAEDMDAAKKLVDGHPYLSANEGKFAVEIHELFPVPGM